MKVHVYGEAPPERVHAFYSTRGSVNFNFQPTRGWVFNVCSTKDAFLVSLYERVRFSAIYAKGKLSLLSFRNMFISCSCTLKDSEYVSLILIPP